MEQKKNDSCSIQKSSFRKLKTLFYFHYTLVGAVQKGFNSLFAVSSIDMAKLYYTEFQKQFQNLPSDQQLKVATIFSYTANEEEPDGTIDENPEDTSGLDVSSRDFLENSIKDYNEMFWTSYDTS